MTSKEAYLNVVDFINDLKLGIERSSIDIIESLNVLRELTKQETQPTFEECIKEWEDDEFEFNKIFCYELKNKKNNIRIYFDNGPVGIECSIEGIVTSKQLIRLIKTFKVLGWEVENENSRKN